MQRGLFRHDIQRSLRKQAVRDRSGGGGVIWWAVVGGGDGDDSMNTPFWVVDTSQLVAGTAALAVVEEGGA
ncbi:hypothetical protein LXL04_035976 [Taraxacum kok-saghyz]